MRRRARKLRRKALDSLVLAVELFNRPSDQGRVDGVLIHLDHAFEMLLKAAIDQRGGELFRPEGGETIGFRACVNKCLSDANVRCLTSDQATLLLAINGWRDAAQHYLLDMSERQLYVATQGGVTLFDDLHKEVFEDAIAVEFPDRVLPVSTSPPTDLTLLLDDEVAAIADLIGPGKRRHADAEAKLRVIAVLERAVAGDDTQPTPQEIGRLLAGIKSGEGWHTLFPGVASLRLDTTGTGLTFSLRISAKGRVPVKLVKEGEGDYGVVAVRRVDELSFYSLGFRELALKFAGQLTEARAQAVIWYLGLKCSEDFYKLVTVGKMPFQRYSPRSLDRIREELPKLDLAGVWTAYRKRPMDDRNPEHLARGGCKPIGHSPIGIPANGSAALTPEQVGRRRTRGAVLRS
jgi:hypothetical protein